MSVFRIIIIALLLQSCSSNTLLIERNESLAATGNIKLICIDPRFYFDNDAMNYDLEKCKSISGCIKKDIQNFSRKNDINLEVRDLNSNADAAYYEVLLKLKTNMLAVNFDQNTPLNFNNSREANVIQKKVFVYPPRISHEFNTLSGSFGTPYFSYMGIYVVNGDLVLYHLVVDTDRAETIYRELKTVSKKVKRSVISQMIYDSYAMLAMELKKL
ncbi:MAG: hypothetical protein V4635_04835 [Bacteroidota bacterium]